MANEQSLGLYARRRALLDEAQATAKKMPMEPMQVHPLAATRGKIMQDRLYTPNDAAAILGITGKTLASWRREGKGPLVTHVDGGRPRYRGQHILDVLDAATNPATPL